jgi:hypothetical protein
MCTSPILQLFSHKGTTIHEIFALRQASAGGKALPGMDKAGTTSLFLLRENHGGAYLLK